VVCANRRYRILQTELARAGIAQTGPKALALTDLTRPVIDWVALAKGFGMPACSVGSDGELAGALSRALPERGPGLIEAVIGDAYEGGTQSSKAGRSSSKTSYDGQVGAADLGAIN
jgi:thiamine pyrophosphate-dependent acetolactate synthase large subunit-like protein